MVRLFTLDLPLSRFPNKSPTQSALPSGRIPEIEETHLPMVYIKGHIDPPSQVLFVVLDEHAPSPQARIAETLPAVLPTDFHMDITELHPDDRKLPTIRATATKLNLNRKLM